MIIFSELKKGSSVHHPIVAEKYLCGVNRVAQSKSLPNAAGRRKNPTRVLFRENRRFSLFFILLFPKFTIVVCILRADSRWQWGLQLIVFSKAFVSIRLSSQFVGYLFAHNITAFKENFLPCHNSVGS